jgi:hypothetical protein
VTGKPGLDLQHRTASQGHGMDSIKVALTAGEAKQTDAHRASPPHVPHSILAIAEWTMKDIGAVTPGTDMKNGPSGPRNRTSNTQVSSLGLYRLSHLSLDAMDIFSPFYRTSIFLISCSPHKRLQSHSYTVYRYMFFIFYMGQYSSTARSFAPESKLHIDRY